jgi:serine/threonine protein phosphatase 1
VIAIGDVHGCAGALGAVLSEIAPTTSDTIVTLGDYIDRGPDSRGVLDTLVDLKTRCHLVPLIGNHEQMLFSAKASRLMQREWLKFGGQATLDSFGPLGIQAIPRAHWALLESCRMHFETESYLFIHANYQPDRPMGEQDEDTALSLSLDEHLPGPHSSGKTVIVGHTVQPSCRILDLGYLKCLDTNCAGGGYLTALDVVSGQIWQASEAGSRRFASADIARHLPAVSIDQPGLSTGK